MSRDVDDGKEKNEKREREIANKTTKLNTDNRTKTGIRTRVPARLRRRQFRKHVYYIIINSVLVVACQNHHGSIIGVCVPVSTKQYLLDYPSLDHI